ncbi:MAG: hypothetical protein ACRESZ_14025 [Methylococcales bacterium]
MLDLSGQTFSFIAKQHPALHPGQSAQILTVDGKPAGWLGMLHLELEMHLGFASRAFLYELDQSIINRDSNTKRSAAW